MSDVKTLPQDEFDRWLRPSEAISILTANGWNREFGIGSLINRLHADIIKAAAEHVLWEPVGGTAERRELALIPTKHWNPHSEWLADATLWQTGDIYFDITGESPYSLSIRGRISYFGVRLDPKPLEKMIDGAAAVKAPLVQAIDDASSSRSRAGRRLSDRWRPWVAELVAYVHENGIPEGIGSQGQEQLIAAVADELARRGEESLSRSTVQPVIQAVLDRLRPAGN